jgi:hypothetical protein
LGGRYIHTPTYHVADGSKTLPPQSFPLVFRSLDPASFFTPPDAILGDILRDNILEFDIRRKLIHFLEMLLNQNTVTARTIAVTTDAATYLYGEGQKLIHATSATTIMKSGIPYEKQRLDSRR